MNRGTGRSGAGRIRLLLGSDIAGSWVLVVAVGAALVWANSPVASSYDATWEHPVHIGGMAFVGLTTVRAWVNGGLMAVFFLVIGLEIGRERRTGELGNVRTAVVPVAGAIGGMAGAGLVYALFNHAGPGASGWGIPMATDIAFALGALALLGRSVPPGLRLLLLTLAVADDIGSVLVLAIFYSSRTNPPALVGAALVTAGLVAARRWRPRLPAWPILVGGVALWALLAAGGVAPALAGVAVGLLVPNAVDGGPGNPAEDLERRIAPVSAFVVLPLFALANAGITVHSGLLGPAGATSVFAGVATARVAGKLVGIVAGCALVVRLGLGQLPKGVHWGHVAGGAAVAGIGFTVPLLIAEQAFADRPPLVEAAELGLLAGSFVAFAVGAVILVCVGRRADASERDAGGPAGEGRPIPW